jgi:hypothetical protein
MISLSLEDPQLLELIPEIRTWADGCLEGRSHSCQEFYADLHPDWFGYELTDVDDFLAHCPRSADWLQDRGLAIRHLALITLDPGHVSPLHRDRLLPDQDPWALNVNIQNCEHTWTEAYRVREDQARDLASTGGDHLRFYAADPALLIARWNLSKPRLFNTQIAHRVVNDTNELRVALSFRFWQNPLRALSDR